MQLPNPGEVLLGKYRVEEIIGVGGMGQVVRASHLYLQQPVAIKILLPEMVDSQATVARFLREAQATVRLRSEHIARVMDVGTMPDGAPFIVMEYLEGHDLNQILRHHGAQMAQAVVDMVLQACEGIAEAHAMGIIHRDIKPSNFFITRRPDGSSLLKILDFGISKTQAEVSELTGAHTVIGTPQYMAPEQMVSARSTDPRSDIWSMGVVMYQLLAGQAPFAAESYAELVIMVSTAKPPPLKVQLPPGLQDIVFRCMEKDPKRRIQNVGELARALAPFASDPGTAKQSAERVVRILTTPRGTQPGIPASTTTGPTQTPQALTPKSWSKTDPSSLSGGAGEVATRVLSRGRRGLLIVGIISLCLGAGVGGFLVASSMKSERKGEAETPAAAALAPVTPATAPATPAAVPTTPAALPSTPDAMPATATVATGTTKIDTAKAASTNSHSTKSDTTKSDTTKSDSTKSDSTKSDSTAEDSTKSDSTKSDSRSRHRSHSRSKTDKPSDDLFDQRK